MRFRRRFREMSEWQDVLVVSLVQTLMIVCFFVVAWLGCLLCIRPPRTRLTW